MSCDVRVVNAGPMPVWSDKAEDPQVANEATDPGQTYAIGSTYISADGITYGSSFTDISSNLASQQLVRFGVFVRNQSSSAGHTELALVTLRVEIQPRS